VTRWTEGVVREVLPNGLTLLAQRVPASSVAAVVTHVRAGYFDEPDEWVGISHVLEHMYFKGTVRRGVGVLARDTKRAGGYLNAGTIYDRTQYYTVVPSESLADAIDIQSDALLHSAIDAGELAREIEVIIQEARRKLDSPGAVTIETLYELLFDRHRMRRWRIGTEEGLRRLTRSDVVTYYRTRYVPRRTIVAVAGDVDPDRALELLRRSYGHMDDLPPATDRSPEEPDHTGLRLKWLFGDVRAAVLALGWRTFGPLDRRAPALDVAAVVAAEGRGSWGFRHLRAPGVVTSIDAAHYTPTEVGVFELVAETEPAQVMDALEGMWAIVRRLAEAGPDDDDLERARALLTTAWARRGEVAEGRASLLAEAEALGDVALADELFSKLLSVTATDVREAASVLMLERAAAVGYVADGVSVESDTLLLERRMTATEPLSLSTLDGGILPNGGPPPSARPRRIADVTLLEMGGVDVLAMRKEGVPLAAVGAVVIGPRSREGPGRAGSSLLLARAALRGAAGLDRDALAVAAERLGGSLATLLAPDWVGWRLTVRSTECEQAARLLAALVREPRLDAADVDIERDLLARDIRHAEDDMRRYPLQLAMSAGFGDDPYGQPSLGTLESVAQLNGEAVRQWYDDVVRGGRLVLAAVGDLEPERAAEMLAVTFDGWGGGPLQLSEGTWSTGRERVERRKKQQSAFVLAFPAFPRSAPDRHALEVLVAIASGLGGRLFDAVRDQRSLAYVVAASPWLWRRAGVLYAYAATAPERAAEARSVMHDELRRFASEEVTPEELAEAIQFTSGMLRVRRQSATAVLHDLIEAHVAGAGVQDLADDEAAVRAVTGANLVTVASRICGAPPVVGMVEGGA